MSIISALKAALFDFDGVICDTESLYTKFWDEQGLRFLHKKNFGAVIKGQTLPYIYETYFAGMDDIQQIVTNLLDVFESEMTYPFIPGLPKLVADLRSRGIQCAVVTSSNAKKMENVYRVHPEMRTMFDIVLTSDDFTRGKPDPECFLTAAARFGVDPSTCAVFEDSFHGLAAGKAAGMTVIALATTNPAQTVTPYCSYVIPDFMSFSADALLRIASWPAITIRSATDDDAAEICSLNRTALGYEYPLELSYQQLLSILSSSFNRFWVATTMDNRVVGYVHATDYECTYSDPLKNIIAIAVNPEFRGCGIGRRLLAVVENWSYESGCAGIRLVSSSFRLEAHQFYLHCGYTDRKDYKNFVKYWECSV